MEYIDYFDQFRDMEPYLEIDETHWNYIIENFDREDIQYSLAVITEDYPIPYREISTEDAVRDFNKLKSFHWRELVFESDWYTKSNYDWDFSKTCIHRKNTGNLASDYFHQENRWKVDHARQPSPERTWNDFSKRRTLMGAAITLKLKRLDKAALRSMIGLRKYICDQFKPSIAKAVYDYYDPDTILDFSAGWGDRLAGFFASESGSKYIGIDPKKDNHPVYKRQVEFYSNLLESRNRFFDVNRKSTDFICAPAEEADLSKYENSVDLIFTSPPYFDLERYSDDNTQSWVRYGDTSEQWLNGFLFPAIENVWKTLKPGGRLIVNITDAYSRGGWHEICDPMNEFIDSFSDSSYEDALGLELVARPQVTERFDEEEIKDKIYCEPAWNWVKI